MRSLLALASAIVALLFCGVPSANAQIFDPDRGPLDIGIGYEYQQYSVLGQRFHNHAFNTEVSLHLFDAITGADARLAVAAEGTIISGFGGQTGGNPNLSVKSLFFGGGPRVSIMSRSRIEPWIHVLAGGERFRFEQTSNLGSNTAFGFVGGAGIDFRLTRRFYWRIQGDYLGTHFQSGLQPNFMGGTGLTLNF